MTTQTERVSDERAREIVAEFSGMIDTMPEVLPDGPGAVSALYTSLSLAEVKAAFNELLALRSAVKPFVDFLEQGRRLRHAVDQAFCDIETGTSAALTKRHFERLETLTREPANV